MKYLFGFWNLVFNCNLEFVICDLHIKYLLDQCSQVAAFLILIVFFHHIQ